MNQPEELSTPEDIIAISDQPEDAWLREQVLQYLRRVPGFVKTAQKFIHSDGYRVLVSEQNAHLFKRAADGTFKPFLREGGRFVENVDLVKIGPDYVSAISNLISTINMAAIARELSSIKAGIIDITILLANVQRGQVRGARLALGQARELSDPTERRREMLAACRGLITGLGSLTGQLKSHIGQMPKAETGFFDGFFSSGLDEAEAKYQQVRYDIAVIKDGIADLMHAYGELKEPAAARKVMSDIMLGLEEASLPTAICRARLIPKPQNDVAPESFLRSFNNVMEMMNARVLCFTAAKPVLISVDIKPEEIGSCL